ncbi:MAG: hypothetical protein U5O15_01465 [Candidatus Krumholzibacteriota bacterium]|nr:hypothetical protein [Candidatus Krumholzibacteriota bacterium]
MKLLKQESIVYVLAIMIVVGINGPKAAARQNDVSSIAVSRGDIEFFGMTHQQYLYGLGDIEESKFISKRVRLGAKGEINSYSGIKIMAEFAGTPKLLDGVINLTPSEKITFSIGQYKPPFGTDFLISATAFPFVNPTKVKKLGTGRDIGMSINVKNRFSDSFSLNFDAGLFNGSGKNSEDKNESKNFISRLEIGLMEMFTIAPNVIIGKTNDAADPEDLSTYGGSIRWEWKNEVVVGEYIHSSDALDKEGWYIWGGHTFVTDFKFLPEIQVLARYEELDEDLNITGDKTDRITLGTNLFVDKKYTKVSLNYQINGEEGASKDNNEIAVNFQLVF